MKAIPCHWPNCKGIPGVSLMLFDSPESLCRHVREAHDSHDFGWTRLVCKTSSSPKKTQLTRESGAMVLYKGKKDALDFQRGDAFADRNHQNHRGKQRHKESTRPPRICAEMLPVPSWVENGHDTSCGIPKTSFVPSYIMGESRLLRRPMKTDRNFSIAEPFPSGRPIPYTTP